MAESFVNRIGFFLTTKGPCLASKKHSDWMLQFVYDIRSEFGI